MARLRGKAIERIKEFLGPNPQDWFLIRGTPAPGARKYEGYLPGFYVDGEFRYCIVRDDELALLVTEYLLKNGNAVYDDEEEAVQALRKRKS